MEDSNKDFVGSVKFNGYRNEDFELWSMIVMDTLEGK